jgi:nitrogenase molybdenum-iron protein beta chain
MPTLSNTAITKNTRNPTMSIDQFPNSAEVKQELLKVYPAKVARKRASQIVVNLEDSQEPIPEITANVRTIPGIISQRGCTYAGCKGVVLGPTRDIVNITHGPIGCGFYSWLTRRNQTRPPMPEDDNFMPYCFSTDMQEDQIIFGGEKKLRAAIQEAFDTFHPKSIGVFATCPVGLIGDDVHAVTREMKEKLGINVFAFSCEGYKGVSQSAGHHIANNGLFKHVIGRNESVPQGKFKMNLLGEYMVDYFAEPPKQKQKTINIIPGWVEPSDMHEIKRLANTLGVETILFPDTSGVLDAPQTGKHQFYPKGGVTIEALSRTAESQATICLGPTASEPAAKVLDGKFKIPFESMELPIGLKATDRFVNTLRKTARVPVPQAVNEERGRLVDMITDMHQYFYGKRVALWGDPDQLVSLAEFLVDLDMRPVYMVTGTPGKQFETRIETALAGRVPEVKYRQGAGADMFLMHQWIKNEPVDLLIGNTYGKYIARDENIPFVRHGFPILDRVGHSYFPTVGYVGGMRLLEVMLNAIFHG